MIFQILAYVFGSLLGLIFFIYLIKKPTDYSKIIRYWQVFFNVGLWDESLTISSDPTDDPKELAELAVKLYTDKMKTQPGKINQINSISRDEFVLIRTRLLCKLNFNHELD